MLLSFSKWTERRKFIVRYFRDCFYELNAFNPQPRISDKCFYRAREVVLYTRIFELHRDVYLMQTLFPKTKENLTHASKKKKKEKRQIRDRYCIFLRVE